MNQTKPDLTKDPGVKEAATKLFWASDDFRRAYSEWMFAHDDESDAKLDALASAQHQIDEAKRALSEAHERVVSRRPFTIDDER